MDIIIMRIIIKTDWIIRVKINAEVNVELNMDVFKDMMLFKNTYKRWLQELMASSWFLDWVSHISNALYQKLHSLILKRKADELQIKFKPP